MPWREVSVAPEKAKLVHEHHDICSIVGIKDILESKTVRNYTVHLNGGVIQTEKGLLSNKFNIETNLDDEHSRMLVRQMLNMQRSWLNYDSSYEESNRHRHRKQTLQLSTNAVSSDAKLVQYHVLVEPNDIQIEITENDGKHHWGSALEAELSPILPEELTKGKGGVKLNSSNTIEGINQKLNHAALDWARTLHKDFDMPYSKVDAKCVKTVCVEPRKASADDIIKMLNNPETSLQLKLVHYDWRDKYSLGVTSIVYRNKLLRVQGEVSEKGGVDVAEIAERTLDAINASLDLSKPVTFEERYTSNITTAIGKGVGSFFSTIGNAIGNQINKPINARRERRAEREKIKSFVSKSNG